MRFRRGPRGAGRRAASPAAAAFVLACVLGALAGCAGDGDPGVPDPGGDSLGALAGRVRLTAAARDAFGEPLDSAAVAVEDAGGITVILSGAASETTATSGGLFEFAGLPPGAYRVEARLRPGAAALSDTLILHGADTTLAAPLEIATSPALRLYPNPFAADHGLGVEFETTVNDSATFRAFTLAGQQVWNTRVAVVPSFYTHVHWGGGAVLDTLPSGPYWIEADWSEGTLRGLALMVR